MFILTSPSIYPFGCHWLGDWTFEMHLVQVFVKALLQSQMHGVTAPLGKAMPRNR